MSVPAQSVKPLTILLVDDNLDAAESLSMLLQLVGHNAFTAASAADALSFPKLDEIDAFLLDIGLPDMSGYDLARTLRSRFALQPKLYIAVTGYGQPQDLKLSQQAGFAHHLVKPIDTQVLFPILASVK